MTAGGGTTSGPPARFELLRRLGSHLAAGFSILLRPPRAGGGRLQPLWPPPPKTVARAVALLLLFAGAMFALDGWMNEQALRRSPDWLRAFFDTITEFGKSGWLLWPLAILLFLIAASPTDKLSRISQGVLAALAVRLSYVFIAIAVPGLFTSLVKRMIGRSRPFLSLMRGEADPYLFMPFAWKDPYTSLPSGHATNVFAAAVAIGALWPQARWVMWIYAAVICISRVMLAAHFPSDVVGGAVVGIVGALLVRRWFAARRLGFTVRGDGSIRALTAPPWRHIKKVAAGLLSQ